MPGPIDPKVVSTAQSGPVEIDSVANSGVGDRYAEGASTVVTTLGPHALELTGDNTAAFATWSVVSVPGAGDPSFPTGTTTGAVTIGDDTAEATVITFPGPGAYVVRATYGDSETEDRAYYVTRPLPVLGTTLSTGAGTPGGAVGPTLSESAGADSPTYVTSVTKVSDASSVTVTTPTTTTPTWTNPAEDADGDSLLVLSQVTDAYGRISQSAVALDLAGTGNSLVTPPASTNEGVISGGSPAAKTFSAFTDTDGLIDNYNASLVIASGTPAIAAGSGLGAYTFSGTADKDVFALKLDARDSSNNVLATAVHVVGIAGAGGGGGSLLDPDEETITTYTTNESNAIAGYTAAQVDFRGPTPADTATIGGADAASFTLVGGADGSPTLELAGSLTPATYVATLTVDNEGGAGYTTANIEFVVTPDVGTMVILFDNNGDMSVRLSDGAWANYNVLSGSYNLRTMTSFADLYLNGAVDPIFLLSRFDQSASTDTYYSVDPRTDTWGGAVSISSTVAPTFTAVDSVNGYGIVGRSGPDICYKPIADIVADGNFSGFAAKRLTYSGGGNRAPLCTTADPTTGRITAVGYANTGTGFPYVSTSLTYGGTWTNIDVATLGWPSGIADHCVADSSHVVVVGSTRDDRALSATAIILYSSDGGVTYGITGIASVGGLICSAHDGAGNWVAVGTAGIIYTAPDPTGTWTARTSGTAQDLFSVMWDDSASEWIATGASGTILSSTDGITWGTETVSGGPAGTVRGCAGGFSV